MIVKNHTIELKDTSVSEMARFRQIMLGIWSQQIESDKNNAEILNYAKKHYEPAEKLNANDSKDNNKTKETNKRKTKKKKFYKKNRLYSNSGEFIRNTTKGTKILIETKNGLRFLSGLDYTNRGTRKAVSKIITYEAHLRGYKGYYGVRTLKIDEENTIAYTNRANTVWINTKQLNLGTCDDYNDLGSTIDHEANLLFGHKGEKDRKNYTFVRHANVYLGQTRTKDFNDTSNANKYSVATGFINRIYNAYLNKEITFEDLKSQVGNFNKLNAKNGVQILTKFDGNGVSIQLKDGPHPVHLKQLIFPEE
ncbi:hypothetical protein [Flavobacterium sp. WG21]|uniref:hypothetical protein n=1 Tax=Flavobacterium sp. WG21 TaxID=1229487 RepID=UPI00034D0D1D|nr:hypothetical protein [Flavobacterium sp. WG21]